MIWNVEIKNQFLIIENNQKSFQLSKDEIAEKFPNDLFQFHGRVCVGAIDLLNWIGFLKLVF